MSAQESLFADSDAVIISSINELKRVCDIKSLRLVIIDTINSDNSFLNNGALIKEINLEDINKLKSVKGFKADIMDRLNKNIPVTATTLIVEKALPDLCDNKLRSAIFLPVNIDNELWGIILGVHKTDYEWKANDLAAFMEITHKIGQALARRKKIALLIKDNTRNSYIINKTSDIAALIDSKGIVKEMFGFFTAIPGYQGAGMTGWEISSIIYEEDRDRFKKDIPLFAKSRKKSEYRIVTQTGDLRWMALSSTPAADDNLSDHAWCFFTDIDQIKASIEKTMQNQSLYRLLADNIQDIVFTADKDFVITYISPSVDKAGFAVKSTKIPATLDALFGKEQAGMIRREMDEELENSLSSQSEECSLRSFTVEISTLRPKGIRTFEVRLSIVRDDSGNPAGFIGLCRDITERKMIEQALLAVEARQRYLLENIQDVLVCYDTKATISYASGNLRHLIGYEPSELIGKSIEEFIHPDMKKKFLEDIAKLKKTNGGGIFEYQLVRKDGTNHWFRINSKPDINEKGELRDVVAVISDIDHYKEIEKDFVASEKKENLYQHIVGKVQDLVWASTLDYMTMYISPSVKTTLGYSVEEALGMEFGTTYKPESLNRFVTLLRQAKEALAMGNLNWTGEITVNQYKRNRRALKGSMSMSILSDAQNTAYGYLAITSFRKRGPNVKSKPSTHVPGRKRGRPKGSVKLS